MKKNILTYAFKGGAAKSSTSSLVASYLNGATLVEVDYINKSDSRLNTSGFYDSLQVNFTNETSDSFFEFESLLHKKGVKVIDVGAVMLDKFHTAMKMSSLYSTLDLIIIPSMDGADDFNTALKFLENIKGEVDPSKIMFSFNRFNNFEYAEVQEQFDTFFNNTAVIQKKYGVDLKNKDNWFVIKDSKVIKKSRARGLTVKSLVDADLNSLIQLQRGEEDDEKRLALTKQIGLIRDAQNLYRDFVEPMMSKIVKKLGD